MLDNERMETRRLRLLLELSRHGSMGAVADLLGTSTSTVSQQIAKLAEEIRTPLVEPDGRRVRLTPAGRRLAAHAVEILAAVEAAQVDLDPDAEPVGEVRVSGFATAIRRTMLPVVARLASSHPGVRVVLREHEPAEALARLAADEADLALVYDYTLAPLSTNPGHDSLPLWSTAWSLGVPSPHATPSGGDTLTTVRAYADADWIGNSRNRADEDVLRVLASMAGVDPHLTHQADSLDLVEDLIVAGLGIGLLPADRTPRPGVALLPLHDPDVRLRATARTRRGQTGWPPLALLLYHLRREG